MNKANTAHGIAKLMDTLGDALEGKEVDIAIPALVLLLANAGAMSRSDPAALLTYIASAISRVYIEADSNDEIIH
jgi:hypothetical protein